MDLCPSRSRTPGVNHSDRAASPYALTIRPLPAADRGSRRNCPNASRPRAPPHGTQRCQRTPDAVQRLSRADGPKARCLPAASSRIARPRACWCALVEPSLVTRAPAHRVRCQLPMPAGTYMPGTKVCLSDVGDADAIATHRARGADALHPVRAISAGGVLGADGETELPFQRAPDGSPASGDCRACRRLFARPTRNCRPRSATSVGLGSAGTSSAARTSRRRVWSLTRAGLRSTLLGILTALAARPASAWL